MDPTVAKERIDAMVKIFIVGAITIALIVWFSLLKQSPIEECVAACTPDRFQSFVNGECKCRTLAPAEEKG